MEGVITDDEIRNELDRLDRVLGSIHNQVNEIAAREYAGALSRAPQPYANPELARKKEELVEKSGKIIDQMQALHKQLVSGATE